MLRCLKGRRSFSFGGLMKKDRMIAFFVILVIFNMAANFAHPVTPTVIHELQLSDYMFGVALGAMLVCNFLFSPFWGKLNSYIPSKTTMFICACGYGIGQIFFGLATSEFMIILARMFAGVFTGGAFVSFLTYTINVSNDQNRAKNLTINATLQSVSGAFGYFIGGFLGEIGVFMTFFIQAITLLVSGVLFYWLLVDDRENRMTIPMKKVIKEANPFYVFTSGISFMSIAFVCLFGITMLSNLGYTAFEQCFNYYLKDQFALTSSYNGIIKAAIGIISLIANGTICMYLIKKTDVSKSIISVLSICSIAMFFVVIVNDLTPFIIVNIIFFAFYAITIPLIQHLVAQKAKRVDSNLVMGFYNATKSLGGIIGAFVAGGIYAFNPDYPFIFGLFSFALASFLAYFYYQRKKAFN
jgi:DHA1 family multidrug resistance protein-like MFS transporter